MKLSIRQKKYVDQYFKKEYADDLDREFVDEFNDLYRECLRNMTADDLKESRENVEKAKLNFKKYRRLKNIYTAISRVFFVIAIISFDLQSIYAIMMSGMSLFAAIFIYFKHELHLKERRNFHYGLIFSIQWEIDEHFRLNSR